MKYLPLLLLLTGCTQTPSVPKLLGPADEFHCTIDRTKGETTGTYKCEIEGRYILDPVSL